MAPQLRLDVDRRCPLRLYHARTLRHRSSSTLSPVVSSIDGIRDLAAGALPRALAVARVAFADLLQKGVHISTQFLFPSTAYSAARARSSASAVRKILSAASGKRPCPCRGRRRPGRAAGGKPAGARAAPRGRRAARRPARRRALTVSARIASVTSRPSSRIALALELARRGRARSPRAAARRSRSDAARRAPRARPAGTARRCRGSGSRAPRRPGARPCPCPRPTGRRSR